MQTHVVNAFKSISVVQCNWSTRNIKSHRKFKFIFSFCSALLPTVNSLVFQLTYEIVYFRRCILKSSPLFFLYFLAAMFALKSTSTLTINYFVTIFVCSNFFLNFMFSIRAQLKKEDFRMQTFDYFCDSLLWRAMPDFDRSWESMNTE